MEKTKTTFGISSISQPAPRWLYIAITVLTVVLGSVALWANQSEYLGAMAKKEVLLIVGTMQGAISLISPLFGLKKEPLYKS